MMLKNKSAGKMDDVTGAELLPDSRMCDTCGSEACNIQAGTQT